MDRGDRANGLGGVARRSMVEGDGLDDAKRQPPSAQQARAHFGVSRTQHLPLRGCKRDLSFPCPRKDAAVFLWQIGAQHQLADVVQHARRKGLLRKLQIAGDVAEHPLGQPAGAHRMTPQGFDGKGEVRITFEARKRVGHQHQRLGLLNAQVADRFRQTADVALQPERGRVDQLQHFRRQRKVLAQQPPDLIQPRVWRLQRFHHLKVNGWHTRQFGEARQQWPDRQLVQSFLQRARLFQDPC